VFIYTNLPSIVKYLVLMSALSVLWLHSCSYTQKIQDGRTAFDRMQFSVAVKLLDKEYAKSKSRIEKGKIAFLMAESFKRLNQSPQSIKWYQIAYDNQYGPDALKELAFALKRAERYPEAERAFKDLGIEIGSPYEYRREVQACTIAAGWKAVAAFAEYTAEPAPLNTRYAEYAPMPFRNNQLVFTSDRPLPASKGIYAWTGNSFSNLFIADLSSDNVTPFDTYLNSADNEGTACFNSDFTEIIFSRCTGQKKEDAYCKLMASDYRNGAWSAPRVLDFVEDKVNYVHPSLSVDGKWLYFSANHPDGWGGYDIYVSERLNGQWSTPKILSRGINTTGDEKFPFIDQDTLYFASDVHPGMGGLDIFSAYKMPGGNWSPPFNLKPPINSGGDDFGFVVFSRTEGSADTLEMGFFSSTRADGAGNDDIYRYIKRIPPPIPTADTMPPIAPVQDTLPAFLLDVYIVEKIFEKPNDPNSKVLGRKPIVGATAGWEGQILTTSEEGFFTIDISPGQDYQFLASFPGYLSNTGLFSTQGMTSTAGQPSRRFELEIVLDRIYTDKEIRLENIYYDFDRWEIRADARPALDRLAQLLTINPSVRIQLGSHTDCRGNDKYNQDLSQRRAQSAVDYLIEKGISPARLSAQGFGESVPEDDCLCSRCTEEEHQRNRRTTFRILE
jgi:peptidoglycan-associated lipoprotein